MQLSEDDIDRLITEIKDYQLTQGSLLKQVIFETRTVVSGRPVGVSLLATAFDRGYFDHAIRLQRHFNELYVRAACDVQWLRRALEPILPHDPLVSALWDVYIAGKNASAHRSEVVCGIFRSDFMVHTAGTQTRLKQVEMNTFSVAGICHAEKAAKMHRHLLRTRSEHNDLPDSENIAAIVKTLSEAHQFFEPKTSRCCGVLMVVQSNNFNVADERPIEYGLWDQNIPCYRCEWYAVPQRTKKTEDGTLIFRPHSYEFEVEISVVYYRAGYEAQEYLDKGKQIRLDLETSRSIQCPDVLGHLVTFKAIQEALTHSGAVERFLPHDQAALVRSTFMPMYMLDTQNQWARARAMNVNDAAGYVLKPNLEGGGHNVYGRDITAFLRTEPEDQWAKYILMERMEPPESHGLLLIRGEVYQGAVVSELGVLGTCLWRKWGPSGAEILSNEVAGWTFKTKPFAINEMNVVKGYGVFDCPRFVQH